MLHIATPASVDAPFYVLIDGFRHEDLTISAATLVGVPNVAPNISFNPPLGKITAPNAAPKAIRWWRVRNGSPGPTRCSLTIQPTSRRKSCRSP